MLRSADRRPRPRRPARPDVRHGCPGQRAIPGPAVPAACLLVAQHDRRHPVRAPTAPIGTTGENSDTTGVPTAAARCAGPVFPRRHTRLRRDAGQLRAGRCAPTGRSRPLRQRAAARSRSAGPPVTTTGQPARDSAPRSPGRVFGGRGPGTAPRRPDGPPRTADRQRQLCCGSGCFTRSLPSSPAGSRPPAATARSSAASTSWPSGRWCRRSSSEPG